MYKLDRIAYAVLAAGMLVFALWLDSTQNGVRFQKYAHAPYPAAIRSAQRIS
jgi:hypothetical protein